MTNDYCFIHCKPPLLRSLLFGANVQCNWIVQPTTVDATGNGPIANALRPIANDLRVMILNVLFYFIDCNYCKSNSSELLINLFYSYSYLVVSFRSSTHVRLGFPLPHLPCSIPVIVLIRISQRPDVFLIMWPAYIFLVFR